MASIAPSDYIEVGATVIVIDTDVYGPTRVRRAKVAKINAHYFTVEDVTIGSGTHARPVQFRNRLGMGANTFAGTTNAHQEANGGTYVVPDDAAISDPARRVVRERQAQNRITRAADAWRKVNERRTARMEQGNRPTADEVDAALVEIIESAVSMREALAARTESATG